MTTEPSNARRVRSGEMTATILSSAYFFFILCAYYVIRPLREQLSAAVGSTQLPWFYGATFIATLALTPLFAYVVSRWPRRIVVPVTFAFFMACLLAFYPFFLKVDMLGPKTLGTVFFVWVSVFNLFIVSVFWSFMTDIWNNAQARRLFPIIGISGTLGAIAGPVLTRTLVPVIGVAPLLLVSVALLGGGLACVLMLGRWAKHAQPEQQHEAEQAMGGSMWEGLRQIFANPFMRTMAILMILGDMIGTIAYALVIDYSKATFGSDAVARTAFAADMDIATNVLQVVVQLTLTRFILARFGAPWVIAIWASAGVSVCLATAFSPDATTPVIGAMPWVALMLIVTRGLVYGMFSPAKESLFTKVPRSLRYKGKNATETAVWRAGDVISALVVNALNASKAGVAVFALIGGSAIAASGVITWRLARRVEGGAFDRVTKNAQTTP